VVRVSEKGERKWIDKNEEIAMSLRSALAIEDADLRLNS
jgi:hypothetical protein